MLGTFTARGYPILFSVSGDRSVIIQAGIVFDQKCSDGSTAFGITSGDKGIRVLNGAFTDSFSGGPTTLPDGRTYQYSDQLSGTFNKAGTQITGTWQETSTLNDPKSGTSVTCDSGKVSFTAID